MSADPYAELHLLPTAPPEVVEAAFRALVKLSHPDVAGGQSTARAARINAAHDVIKSGRARSTRGVSNVPPAAYVRMPWGKHKGEELLTIPSDYFLWLLANATNMQPGLRADIKSVLAWRR